MKEVDKKCPNCGSLNTAIDYGLVDDDDRLPPEVQEGGTFYFCFRCAHEWCIKPERRKE